MTDRIPTSHNRLNTIFIYLLAAIFIMVVVAGLYWYNKQLAEQSGLAELVVAQPGTITQQQTETATAIPPPAFVVLLKTVTLEIVAEAPKTTEMPPPIPELPILLLKKSVSFTSAVVELPQTLKPPYSGPLL